MEERESVRIQPSTDGCVVHETADRKVGHHEAVEFLTDQIRRFAPQDDPGAAQVGL
jgi:hypothetical protein